MMATDTIENRQTYSSSDASQITIVKCSSGDNTATKNQKYLGSPDPTTNETDMINNGRLSEGTYPISLGVYL